MTDKQLRYKIRSARDKLNPINTMWFGGADEVIEMLSELLNYFDEKIESEVL